MKTRTLKTLFVLGAFAAGVAQAASNGDITTLTASSLKPKVGEAVIITVGGTLQPGKKCHIYGGTVSPYKDLGLLSTLPGNVATTFTFNAPGPQYIHVYPGTEDVDNTCTQSGPNSVKVDVGAPGGNISTLDASSLKPKVGEAVSITLGGTLDPGKKCHIYGGTKSPYVDLGLVSSFPFTLPTTFTFNAPGVNYIHVYLGTLDTDNVCTQTAPAMVKVDVGAPGGNISGISASTLTPKVGEAVTIKLDGTLDPGRKCHIYGGTVSPYKDLGLVGALPGPVATTFAFNAPGPQYIHVYPGTEDVDNVCTQTGSNSVKVDVVAAPLRMMPTPQIIQTPPKPKIPR
jgi:ribosomal protein L21E